MTHEELDKFLEANKEIEWGIDGDDMILRHTQFDKENEGFSITPKGLVAVTPEKLLKILTAGRNIDHITRITGYFSKVSGWNKGKKGELHDRVRTQIH